MLEVFSFIIGLLVILLIYSMKKPQNFPPGPPWIPFVGNMPLVKKLSMTLGGHHAAFVKLAKDYKTKTLGLKLEKDLAVIVSSTSTIKHVFTEDEYEGRPDNFFMRLRCFGERRGITCMDGEVWLVLRNFVLRHLRSLGFGKKGMEMKIKEEIDDLLEIIKQNGEKLYIGRLLSQAVINVLWSLIAGKRISRDDPRFNKLLDLLAKRVRAFNMSGTVLNQHPWLRFIAPERTGYNLIKEVNAELKDFLMEAINEHYRTWTEGRNDDLIYSFISEMKQANNYPDIYTDDQLLMVCLDLFVAGAHTTSNSTDFAFLMMLLHPDVQAKAQNVLDDVYDENKQLEYIDRYEAPYIEAVLCEILRYRGVTPVVGPRRTTKDTVLDGYNIAKNTSVVANTYAIHMDEEIWGDPDVFRPERFLDSEGKLISHDSLIPFGLGKRRCLGEPLARNCLFMFFSEILRNYTIKPVEGLPMPTGKPLPGLILSPEKYFAQFIPRRVS